MKKLFIICLLLSHGVPAYADLTIFACEPEWAALSQELGGENVTVYSATTGLQDPHFIQAKPSLIVKARKADLLVCTGAELEIGWLPLLQRKSANAAIQNGGDGYFMATDYVTLSGIPAQLDRSHGDVHAMGNPHIQTNPHHILLVAEALSKRIQQLDSSQQAAYQARWLDFKQRWQTAILRWEDQAKPLVNMPVVIQHNSWDYLLEWLQLDKVTVLEAKSGVPPTISELNSIVQVLEATSADVIIHAAYQPPKASNWLANKTGIPVISLPFTVGGDANSNDLFSLFDTTLMLLLSVQK